MPNAWFPHNSVADGASASVKYGLILAGDSAYNFDTVIEHSCVDRHHGLDCGQRRYRPCLGSDRPWSEQRDVNGECSNLVIMDKRMKLTVTEGWHRLRPLPLPPGDS